MQVPYWTALAVHLASAAVYPLFVLARQWVVRRPLPGAQLARWWALALGVVLVSMGVLWGLGESGREFKWPFPSVQVEGPEGRFLRHMTAHHVVGLRLSKLAAERSHSAALRDLGELMAAEHTAEIARMRLWWHSWFDGDMPGITDQEYHGMVGMPPPVVLEKLEGIQSERFVRLFLPVMLRHHEGALVMCNHMLHQGHDPRPALLALSISHVQRQQMVWMRQLLRLHSDDGSAAVPYTW
jgi:uncharacterized protein (DUF305 family)